MLISKEYYFGQFMCNQDHNNINYKNLLLILMLQNALLINSPTHLHEKPPEVGLLLQEAGRKVFLEHPWLCCQVFVLSSSIQTLVLSGWFFASWGIYHLSMSPGQESK